ncbi:MAG: hypothetical protein MSH57_05995 [Prevotella sp.]|nr:hypothetical protein [Prevotella sp.]
MLGKKARVNYGMVYTHIIDHSRQDYVSTEDTTTDKLPSPLHSRRTEDILNIYVLSVKVLFCQEENAY